MAFARSEDHLDGDQLDQESLFVPYPERSSLFEVPDTAWRWAGIEPGDLLVVERGRMPADGDLLLVYVDGRARLGRVVRDRGSLRLEGVRRPLGDDAVSLLGIVPRFLRIFDKRRRIL